MAESSNASTAKVASTCTKSGLPAFCRSSTAAMLITFDRGRSESTWARVRRRTEASVFGIGICANQYGKTRNRPLKERFVDVGLFASRFGIGFYVFDYSHNLSPLRRRPTPIETNLFPERFLIVQQAMDKFPVDQNHGRGGAIVRFREAAALPQPNARGSKILRSNHIVERGRCLLRRCGRVDL